MDTRIEWQLGDQLTIADRTYRVSGTQGKGSNSIVYRVSYLDALCNERHHALLKELYPNVDGVERIDGQLHVTEEARPAFELHKRSFLRGNAAHLRQLQTQSGRVTGNRDSWEANGTLYTLLDQQGERTLQNAIDFEPRISVEQAVKRVYAILDALAPFHEEGLLHLDVSPDNLLLLPVLHSYQGDTQPMLLIDYNSVWDGRGEDEPCFSSKAGYTPPETRVADRSALCPATDLFSVCAIFFQLLTGRTLTETECCGQFLARVCDDAERACINLPATAVTQVVRILRKGLQPLPRRRYACIDELRQALGELLNRIYGKGVTHAALWEASRQCQIGSVAPRSTLALQLCLDGQLQPATADLPLERSLVLTGVGGSGKTSLLRAIHTRYTARYSPAESICYPISLFRWRGGSSFVHACLTEHLRSTDALDSPQAMYDALDQLLQAPLENGKPFLILLLDGLNETGPHPEALLREIRALADCKSVRVVVSSRDAQDTARLGFAAAELLPPSKAEIDRFLAENGLQSVTTPEIRRTLTQPLLLTLYADTWAAWRGSGESLAATDPDFSSPESLRQVYLEGQLTLYTTRHRESDSDCLRARYAVHYLLPAVARAMGKRPVIDWKRLRAVVAKDYRTLRGKSFGMAHPEFLGKTRVMLEGVRSADEWYDLMIRDVLCARLALLLAQPDGSYALPHESFLESLAKEGRRNRQRLLRPRLLYWLIGAACVGLLVGGALTLWPSKTLSTAEQAALSDLQSTNATCFLQTSELLLRQQEIRDYVLTGNGHTYVERLVPTPVDTTSMLTDVPWTKLDLPPDAWRTTLNTPQDASRLFLGALLVLTQPEGNLTLDERAVEYDSMVQRYKEWYVTALYLAYDGAPEKVQKDLYDCLQASSSLRDTFIRVAKPQGNLIDRTARVDTARKALESTLFYPLAEKESEKWEDTQSMVEELQRRLP